jgi:hypothetical protein
VAGTSCVPSPNSCNVGSLQCGDNTVVPAVPPSCVDTGIAVTCPSGQTCVAGVCH